MYARVRDREVPRLVPTEFRPVEQDAHQLGHGHRRMGVVELDGDLVRQRRPVVPAAAEPGDDVGQGAGDQEILLDEPERPPPGRRVVRVEDAADRLREDPVRHRAEEIAAAELAEVEDVRSRGLPEPEGVDRPPAVADHRPIAGHARAGSRAARAAPRSRPRATSNRQPSGTSTVSFGRATSHGSGRLQPVVGLFDLGAVADLLAEDPVIVAEAVSDGRDGHRGHGFDEARREPAEPAVAEAGVRLLLEDFGEPQAPCPWRRRRPRARASGW